MQQWTLLFLQAIILQFYHHEMQPVSLSTFHFLVFLLIMQVNYLPLSLMVTAFKKEDVKKPLEGFGVLIPYKEQQKHGLKTLGRSA
jgi:hypothetical protein